MRKIISVCSEKGGVGKTTTTINVANSLAKLGKKVLVIDLDQQGNASRQLGFVKDGKQTTSELIYNTVAGNEVSDDVIRTGEIVDYIPASPMLTGITTFMANDADSNYILKRALADERFGGYDYILLDCRTLLDLLAANAMNASTHVIIPVESGVFSFDGLSKMLGKVTSVNASTNKGLKVLGILLNKQQRTNVSASIADSVRDEYSKLVFNTTVPFCPAQAENAVLAGTNGANGTLGTAFEAIAKEIIERAED